MPLRFLIPLPHVEGGVSEVACSHVDAIAAVDLGGQRQRPAAVARLGCSVDGQRSTAGEIVTTAASKCTRRLIANGRAAEIR